MGDSGGVSVNRRRLVGVTCGLSVYGCAGDGSRVFLQCVFLDTGRGDPFFPQLKSFMVCCRCPSDRRSDGLRKTYLSVLHKSEDERMKTIRDRNRAIAALLNSGGPVIGCLAKTFVPVTITVDRDETEILDAELIRGDVSSIMEFLGTCEVAKFAAVGTYTAEAEAVVAEVFGRPGSKRADERRSTWTGPRRIVSRRTRPGTAVREIDAVDNADASVGESDGKVECAEKILTDYHTHANKKLCRGYGVSNVSFSFRIADKKYVFDCGDQSAWPVNRVFSSRDIAVDGNRFRLVTPVGFLAIALASDQCYLSLRAAMARLHAALYVDFTGTKPVFDYIGPDYYSTGGPKSVYFTGFPWLSVYFVSGNKILSNETVIDAVSEKISDCGLPDIVGPDGKFKIALGDDLPSSISREEIRVFYSPEKPVRINGNHFKDFEISGERGTDSVLSIYTSDSTIHRIFISDMRINLLRRCVPRSYFPPTASESQRRTPWDVCTRFMNGLKHQSGELYTYIRGLENFLSEHITSACTAAGFTWIMVRHDSEFYITGGAANGHDASAETCIRTVLGCYWQRLFGASAGSPACSQLDSGMSVLLVSDCRVISSFRSVFDTHGDAHWTCVMGDAISDTLSRCHADPDWFGAENIKSVLRSLFFKFISMRHRPEFWLETFEPATHPTEKHHGVLDCAPFDGVWSDAGHVIVQSIQSALSDRIGYRTYIEKAIRYLKLSLRAAVRRHTDASGAQDADAVMGAMDDTISSVKVQLIDDYMGLFNLN
ncbi:B102 [miniopterid betaherpesvirus 1]|uniref:B102 n=1 Tax=miniopterid betaherpesvirus 1 TaxID=3070189 RepID=I3VQ96_9BETA|nr:B102 [miniopterid betaherpesvirus 1]AFK83940.1 B102 [miniopterid betaherpesvirus 1]